MNDCCKKPLTEDEDLFFCNKQADHEGDCAFCFTGVDETELQQIEHLQLQLAAANNMIKTLQVGHNLIWKALFGDQVEQAEVCGLTPIDEIKRLREILHLPPNKLD